MIMMMKTSLNTKGQTVQWHFISLDMIFNIQRQFNLLINVTYLGVQSFLFIIKLNKFKLIHCIWNSLMPRPPTAKPLISVLYMKVSIMWVLRSLTNKLLQIFSILRILLFKVQNNDNDFHFEMAG